MIAPTLDCGGGGCEEGEECLPDDYIDPADCPEVTCSAESYMPYCITENATDLDTLILSLSPWSYYPMNDASGLIQDASGNGRHATSVAGTPTYAQTPITSKAGNSIRFNGSHFVIPKPYTNMSFTGQAWTMIWLELVTARIGSGSNTNGSALLGVSGAGAPGPMPLQLDSAGANNGLLMLWDATHDSYTAEIDLLNWPVAFGMTMFPAANGTGTFLNGVQWLGAGHGNASFGDLCIGKSDDAFWGWPDHRISNFAMWNTQLSHANILAVSEAMLDEAALALAYVP